MKKLYLILLLLPFISYGQPGTWTWMNGDSAANHNPNFGQQGVPSPTNDVGTRYAPGFWTDTAGNFWVYSGFSIYSYTTDDIGQEDLWKFDPIAMEWTWENGDETGNTPITVAATKGQYSSSNTPGYLNSGMFTWVTSDNHLWLYGGATADAEGNEWVTDNLWQYDPAINEWAWMGALGQATVYPAIVGTGNSTTTPGARYESNAAWTDNSGNLWLFGGYFTDTITYYSYQRNDMWEYDVATGVWKWMSGSKNENDAGVYGSQGVSSTNYYPAARETNLFWKDNSGNFWLGGGNQEVEGNVSWYEDIWKFNPVNLEWTWVSGTSGVQPTSTVGSVCQADTLNTEGSRYENRAVWKICDELIVNFGGSYNFSQDRVYGDLWAYYPNESKWQRLTTGADSLGHYGALGVADTLNAPPARRGAVSFKDKNNNIWMFGGVDYSDYYYYNDLWKYVLDPHCLGYAYCGLTCSASTPVISAGAAGICPNDSVNICATGGYAAYIWNTAATGNCIEAKDSGSYYVNVTDSAGCTGQSDTVGITALQPPSAMVTASPDTICPSDSSYICAPAGFISYAWNNSLGTTSCIEATGAGDYYVTVTNAAGCSAESNHVNITVYQTPQVGISQSGDTLSVYNALNIQWYRNNQAIPGDTGNTIIAHSPGSYVVEITDSNGCATASSAIVITSIENISEDQNISIFPNPSSAGNWQLAVGNGLIGAQMEILDADGRIIPIIIIK